MLQVFQILRHLFHFSSGSFCRLVSPRRPVEIDLTSSGESVSIVVTVASKATGDSELAGVVGRALLLATLHNDHIAVLEHLGRVAVANAIEMKLAF